MHYPDKSWWKGKNPFKFWVDEDHTSDEAILRALCTILKKRYNSTLHAKFRIEVRPPTKKEFVTRFPQIRRQVIPVATCSFCSTALSVDDNICPACGQETGLEIDQQPSQAPDSASVELREPHDDPFEDQM